MRIHMPVELGPELPSPGPLVVVFIRWWILPWGIGLESAPAVALLLFYSAKKPIFLILFPIGWWISLVEARGFPLANANSQWGLHHL